jgi:type 2 lantibiotic biosynthesis protein LanM
MCRRMGEGCSVFEATRDKATEPAGDWPAGWWHRALAPAEHSADGEPAWISFIESALGGLETDTGHRYWSNRESSSPAEDVRIFEPVVRPLLIAAERELLARLAELPVVEGASEAAQRTGDVLAAKLCRTVMRTLLVQLHERSSGQGGGRAHLDALLRDRGTNAGLRALLLDRPLLARLLGIQSVNHVAAVAELVQRLTADLALIEQFAGLHPGRSAVSEFQIGSGDVHRGGRTVAVVRFTDGTRVVYKPRPGELQAHLGQLLAWYRDRLPQWAPRLPRTLLRSGYCWEEFVTARPCTDIEAVERFYRRQGTLLAVLYVLGCTDVHYENLIAHAEEPLVVDIETAFHPSLLSERVRADPAASALFGSVVRVGMLPMMIEGDDRRLDVSALSGGAAGFSPQEVPMLAAIGTDGMHLERRPVPLAAAANRPELDGVRMNLACFRLALLTGFRNGYELLSAEAGTVRALISGCRDDEVRVVARDTYLYATILDEASHPDLLQDPVEHDRFLRRLSEMSDDSTAAALIDGEVAQLWQCDVPVMLSTPSATLIRAAGDSAAAPVAESAIERTETTLTQMSARDLRLQEWIIEASLATVGPPIRHRASASRTAGGAGSGGPDQLVAHACGIADELVATAHVGADRLNWLGLEPSDGSLWSLAPLGASLGDGFVGVALFLYMTHRISRIQRYYDAAARVVASLPALLLEWIEDPEAAGEIGGGAMDGLGGIAWALGHLTQTVDGVPPLLPPSTLEQALVLCERIVQDVVAQSEIGDVADGLAGLTVTMQALVASPVAAVSASAAKLARQLVGLAGRPAYKTGGAYYRTGEPGDVSWCAGLAGRLVTGEFDRVTVMKGIADLAAFGPLADHAPCHGEIGVLEALAVLTQRGSAAAEPVLRERMTRLLGALASGGAKCATPGGGRTPGFRYGLAGIGYGLLRLADPLNVPSVLMFDVTTDRSLHTD